MRPLRRLPALLLLLAGFAASRAHAQGAANPAAPLFLNINPSWSPDGSQLVFESLRHGRIALYVINADGSGRRQLTDSRYANAWPQWSPDGTSIVFASTRDRDWEIYTMKADGSEHRRLTFSPGRDAHPAYLPGGERIVFQSPRDFADPNEVELYRMNADGRAQRRLVTAPGFDGVPVPSPDGRRVAFQRGTYRPATKDFHWELFLVDSAGANERRRSTPIPRGATSCS